MHTIQFGKPIEVCEKPWGSYTVWRIDPGSKIKTIDVNPNQRLSYQSHEGRDELWTVIDGSGEIVLDDILHAIGPGSVVQIKVRQKHRLIAGPLGIRILEVQLGICKEDDIVRYQDDYHRK